MPAKKPFCGNKLCCNHKILVPENRYVRHTVTDNGQQVIERHMYSNRSGDMFELCSVCHEAIQMMLAGD